MPENKKFFYLETKNFIDSTSSIRYKKTMNIVVPIKQVPDTGASLRIDSNKQAIEEEGLKWVINPYDEFAVEEALKLKAQFGFKVFVISLGPERHKEALLSALALGADEALHLIPPKLLIDPLAISQILSNKIKELDSVSLVLCGKLATDTNDFSVPQMLAYFLNFSCVTNANHLELTDSTVTVKREKGGGVEEVLSAKLPSIISVDKGINTPRYPSLPGIMKAKKKPYKETKLEMPKELITQKELSPPPLKSPPEMLEGTAEEQVAKLIDILKDKEKLL